MAKRLGYFGGSMRVQVDMDADHAEASWLNRDVWFDRDLDGRWLVGVTGPDPTDEMRMGAIIIRDQTMSHFIETLGQLLANPAAFADEPTLMSQE